jgi:hypothetical protein
VIFCAAQHHDGGFPRSSFDNARELRRHVIGHAIAALGMIDGDPQRTIGFFN